MCDVSDISGFEMAENLCDDLKPCNPSPWVQATFYFKSSVSNLVDLTDVATGQNAAIFEIRREQRVVTLQWGAFTGTITKNGIPSINVLSEIQGMPSSLLTLPTCIVYKDIPRNTRVEVDPTPSAGEGNLTFFLNSDASSDGVFNHDFIKINGGSIQWIVAPQ